MRVRIPLGGRPAYATRRVAEVGIPLDALRRFHGLCSQGANAKMSFEMLILYGIGN